MRAPLPSLLPRAFGAGALVATAAALLAGAAAGAATAAPDDPAREEAVVRAARVALEAHLSARGALAVALPRPSPAGTVPPDAAASLRARALAPDTPVEPRMRVRVEVHADGRVVRSLPVAFHVTGTVAGWAATRDLPAGLPVASAISDGGLVAAAIPIDALRAPALATPPGEGRLRRAMLRGDALGASHVETAPAVARGDTVSLVVRGPVGIEAKAEALQDGPRGAVVWVRVANAVAPVRAHVVAAGAVEVLP